MSEERQSQPGQEPKRRKRRRPLRNRNKHQRKPQASEAPAEAAPVAAESEKARRERSERRRRRRAKAERQGQLGPVTPEPQVDDLDFQPPASVFVYTHVIRPAASGYEFRSDPFSKLSRRLEDFHIDLSSLFHEEGEMRPTTPKLERGWAAAFEEDFEDDDYGEPDDEEDSDDSTVPSEME